jgi:PKD repeat protein
VFFLCLFIGMSAASEPLVNEGLTVFISFDEGTGTVSSDLTGNGHDPELLGTSWGAGFAAVGSGSDMIRISSHPDLRSESFTYDLWFEAGSTVGNGRIINQSGAPGGTGPDVLERSRHVAFRINNDGAVFNEPTIGSRSNSGPPDHWGTSEDSFHRGAGPEHLVITHDAGSKTVHIFLGLEGQPLKHTFAASYEGFYNVSSEALAMGNTAEGNRAFSANFFQFAYYDRPLDFSTDSNRNVNGGEVLDNHLAGPDADLSATGLPRADAGGDKSVAVNEVVLLDGSGSTDPDGSIVHYHWDFGDGSTGSDEATTHAYQSSGRFDVVLTVTDDDGNSDSDTVIVFVPSLDAGVSTSPSGHYLTYDGRPVLLAGDSGTQCVMQNANLDHRAWINDSAARGINAVHIWSFMGVRQKQDGSVTEDRWGYVLPDITPWARSTSGSRAKDQKYRWDLFTFDEGPNGDFSHYWPKLRDLISHAKSKGMLVGITVFFGGAKDNWQQGWHPFLGDNGGPSGVDSDCDIVAIESPGTEVQHETWSDSWSRAKKIQWLWERYSQKLIDETLGFGNVFYVFMDEHSYCSGQQQDSGDHFRDFFRSRGAYWADWGQRRTSLDMVYDQRLLESANDDRLEEQFGRSPHRPFIGLEEGGAGEFNYSSDLLYMVWKYLIEGGNYFHHNDGKMETGTTGVMVYDPHSTPHGRMDKVHERQTWMGNAARFFNQVENLDLMSPDDNLVSDGDCLAVPGREYLVYLPNGGSFALDLTGVAGMFTVEQFNCRTGEEEVLGTVTGGTTVDINAPNGDHLAFHIFLDSAAPKPPAAPILLP